MAITKPIFRIFDYKKATEFYVDWLGFEINWEHRFGENFPIYLQISLGEIVFHLSEHSGDCTPGSKVFIENFEGLDDFFKKLTEKNYAFSRPKIEKAFWDDTKRFIEVIDPFGNKIMFTGQ